MDDKLVKTPINWSKCKMSSSLKKKLRKQGRYHGSPISGKLTERSQARSAPSRDTSSVNKSPQISSGQNVEELDGPDLTVSLESPREDFALVDDCVLEDIGDEQFSVKLSEKSQLWSPSSDNSSVNNVPKISSGQNAKELDLSTGSDLTASLESPREDHALVVERVLEDVSDEKIPVREPSDNDVSLANESLVGYVNLLQDLKAWEQKVKEKQELLRKLKLVKLYRSKNNLDKLKGDIALWRIACQNALLEYRDKCGQDPAPSLTEIINHMQIDFSLVNYNPEEDSFMD